MSHFASIQTQIRDTKALGSACSEIGLELVPDTEARGYGSNHRHGDFVIRLRGPYDIALSITAARVCSSRLDREYARHCR